MVEVQALDEKNGGGNRAAIKQWLAGVPESVRPTPDSHIDVKKAFITRAYDKREWVNAVENHANAAKVPATSSTVNVQPQDTQRPVQKEAPLTKPASSNRNQASSNVSSVNLLDDDSFVTQGSQSQVPASTQNTNAAANLLDDSFFSSNAPSTNVTNAAPSSSSLGGFDPLLGGSVAQSSRQSAFSFISQASEQPVSSPQPSNGFGTAGLGCIAPNGTSSLPAMGQACESSAFSFIAASQGNQPSTQVPFDPLLGAAPPMQPQQHMQTQLGNFAQGYATTPGMLPQQSMWAPGSYAHGQMNPCAQQWGGMPAQFPMAYCSGPNLGNPRMGTGVGSSPLPSSSDGLATTTPQPPKPQKQSNEASSFDPFDPFAPGPISVCA